MKMFNPKFHVTGETKMAKIYKTKIKIKNFEIKKCLFCQKKENKMH